VATYSIRQLSEKVRRTISPCAVCDDTKYLQVVKPGDSLWQIKCMNCMTTGPAMPTRAEAIEMWTELWDS